MFVVRWMMFPVGAIRHDDLIFHAWILEELAFAMFKYANHAIWNNPSTENRLVDRGLRLEKMSCPGRSR